MKSKTRGNKISMIAIVKKTFQANTVVFRILTTHSYYSRWPMQRNFEHEKNRLRLFNSVFYRNF